MAAQPESLRTIGTFDWGQFNCLYDGLLSEHKKIRKTGRMNDQALETAERLAASVHDLRLRITSTDSVSEANEFLKNGESLFGVAHLMSEMVADPAIETFDRYIAHLARSTHDLMNIAVCQCELRKRRISSETADAIRKNLQKVINTLPFEECEAEFFLKCAHTAAKRLGMPKGTWRPLVAKHVGELAEGAVGVIFSASPLPPFVSLAPLAPPVMHLCVGIYSEMQERWFEAIWTIMFQQEQGGFKDLAIFRELKANLIKNESDHKGYFFLTILFRDMLQQSTGPDESIKEEIISADDLSLKTLVRYQERTFDPKTRRNEEKLSRVRYNALKVLGNIEGSYGITPWIVERTVDSNERQEVKELARVLLRTRLPRAAPQELQGVHETISAGEYALREQQADLADQLTYTPEQVKVRIQELSAELAKFQGMLKPTKISVEEGIGDELDRWTIEATIETIQREKTWLERAGARQADLLDNQKYLSKLREALETGDWSVLD